MPVRMHQLSLICQFESTVLSNTDDIVWSPNGTSHRVVKSLRDAEHITINQDSLLDVHMGCLRGGDAFTHGVSVKCPGMLACEVSGRQRTVDNYGKILALLVYAWCTMNLSGGKRNRLLRLCIIPDDSDITRPGIDFRQQEQQADGHKAVSRFAQRHCHDLG